MDNSIIDKSISETSEPYNLLNLVKDKTMKGGGKEQSIKDKSNKYYTEGSELFKKITKGKNPHAVKLYSKNNIDYIELTDKDNNIILKGEYDVIGLHDIKFSMWYWGWAIPYKNLSITNKSLKIKQFKKELKDNYKNYDKVEADHYYYYCKTASFLVDTDIVEKVVKFGNWVMKGEFVYPVKYGASNKLQLGGGDPKEKVYYDKIEWICIRNFKNHS